MKSEQPQRPKDKHSSTRAARQCLAAIKKTMGTSAHNRDESIGMGLGAGIHTNSYSAECAVDAAESKVNKTFRSFIKLSSP